MSRINDLNLTRYTQNLKAYINKNIEPLEEKANEFSQVFYTEESWEEVANGTYTSVPMEDFGGAYGMTVLYAEIQENIPAILKVELDRVTYSNLTLTETGDGEYAAGNLSKLNSLMGTDYEDTGEPFIIGIGGVGGCLVATDLTRSTTHDIKVYFFESVIKIDGKHLHQPDWNQNDSTQPDYIKNRPFCDEDLFITWNGEIGDREIVDTSSMSEGSSIVKVSDVILTYEELLNAIATFNDGSRTELTENVIVPKEVSDTIGGYGLGGPVISVFDPEKVQSTMGITLSTGTYFLYRSDTNMYVGSLSKASGIIKKIDEKYLPDLPKDLLRTADKDELNSNIVSLENSMNNSMNFYDRKIQEHSNEISDIHDDIDDIRATGKVLIATFNITSENTQIHVGNLSGTIKIDWGDGVVSIDFDLTNAVTPHTYSNPGEYVCKIYGVTSIGNSAFHGYDNLTEIIIPDSVATIGNSAFYACNSLMSVKIPDSVTSIGHMAFESCTNLKSIAIGAGAITIGDQAFALCENLTSVVIPDSVTTIGDGVFSWCSSLTSVVIGNGVTSIDGSAFYDCSSLTSVVIPDSVTSIGDWAFYNCSSLTNVVIGDSVTSIGERAFDECRGLTNVKIPDSVTSIGNFAFGACTSLTSIIIPNSVMSIGRAFSNCVGLTSIVLGDGITSIDEYAFDYCSLTSVVIPKNVTTIGNWAFYWCDDLMSVIFKSATPPTIGVSSFFKRNKFTHIYVPYGMSQAYKEKWATDGIDQSILDLIVESDREAMMSDLNSLVGDINTALEAILGV